ncbi:MAG: cation diffusion facilitator family transporter, partial [Hyphomicrobiaceae bacterium]
AGISVYEGVQKLLHPHPMTSPAINYVVLVLAMLFEGVAWWIAYKEFNKTRGDQSLFAAVRHSKDPAIFTVLFEDTAAMLGLFVAFAGVFAAHILEWDWADGAASVLIGVILALAAWILAQETKGLLIGEAASPQTGKDVRQIIGTFGEVRHINELKTMHLGPNDILMVLSIDFHDNMTSVTVEDTVSKIEKAIKDKHPQITRLFIEVQSEQDHARSVAIDEARRSSADTSPEGETAPET